MAMITTGYFARELRPSLIRRDFGRVIEAHQAALAPTEQGSRAVVAWDTYTELHAAGMATMVGAYTDAGFPVGYSVAIISPCRHVEGRVIGVNDAFYVAEDHRNGRVSNLLLRSSEKLMKRRGVTHAGMVSRVKQPIDALLKRGGYTPEETTWLKALGD